MRMIDGSIQDYALTLDKLLDHGAKWHSGKEVVTAYADGSTMVLVPMHTTVPTS